MKNACIIFCLLIQIPLVGAIDQSITSKIISDIQDTLATGMPIALFAGIWWGVANRVPRSWHTLSDPAATFIRTTWKEQGFAQADQIILKEIPANSWFAKVIMYTQELPHALAIGIPFKNLIEENLHKQELLRASLTRADVSEKEREGYRQELAQVEQTLHECRFVCGHERVHKEHAHTIRMLVIQFVAPFIVYSFLKHSANALDRRKWAPAFSAALRKGVTRSTIEMLIFWCSAHWYEMQADLHASTKPEEIEAGIKLFERAHAHKRPVHSQDDLCKMVFSWMLKYTHPTMPERILYLKRALEKAKSSF